jgi:hypothetical protein
VDFFRSFLAAKLAVAVYSGDIEKVETLFTPTHTRSTTGANHNEFMSKNFSRDDAD